MNGQIEIEKIDEKMLMRASKSLGFFLTIAKAHFDSKTQPSLKYSEEAVFMFKNLYRGERKI